MAVTMAIPGSGCHTLTLRGGEQSDSLPVGTAGSGPLANMGRNPDERRTCQVRSWAQSSNPILRTPLASVSPSGKRANNSAYFTRLHG